VKRVVVVLNGRAGGLRGSDRGASAERLKDAFTAHDVEADIVYLEKSRVGGGLRDVLARGVDALVAAGGDGTVNTVANALAGGSVPLGILPLGTLNHFARDLGIPLALGDAVRVVAEGTTEHVDVGEVNGVLFVNNCSIGLYPHIVTRRNSQTERLGRGKWWAMALAALTVFRRFPTLHVELRAGDRTFIRRTPFVFVGNNEYEMHLFALGSRACVNAGMLSLYVANRPGRFGLLRLAVRALLGRLSQAKDFDAACVPEVLIETRRRRMKVALDGELFRMRPPLRCRARRAGLEVILPKREVEP
jgi:diacylglycerol kinase family enzyme